MAQLAEMEALNAQMEDLQDQLESFRIREAHRGQNKDVSLVVGIKEWTGESKGRRSAYLTRRRNVGCSPRIFTGSGAL
jgi:hypothetical protein